MSKLSVRIDKKALRGIGLLRIDGVDRITPLILMEVADLCFENYKTCDSGCSLGRCRWLLEVGFSG